MERRFTAFLIPALVAVLAIMIFGPKAEEKGQPEPTRASGEPDRTVSTAAPAVVPAGVPAVVPARPATEIGGSQQDQGPSTFVRDFGRPGEEGYRIVFDRRGAAIRRISLLDHFDSPEPTDDSEQRSDFYSLVEEEVYTTDGVTYKQHWFSLEFDQGSAANQAGLNPSIAPWQVVDPDANPIVFTLPLDEGLILERSYGWQPGRRDLSVSLALRSVGDERHNDVGKLYKLKLTGLAVRSPSMEYVLGGNPARAMGAEENSADGALTTIAVAASTQRGAQPLVDRSTNKTIAFAGSTNRFFGSFLYPINDAALDSLYMVEVESFPKQEMSDYPARSLPVPLYHLNLEVPDPRRATELNFRLYLGPKSFRVFEEQPDYAQLDAVVDQDLIPLCFCSIPGVQTIAHFLLWFLSVLQGVVGNWGVAIMILTLMVRGSLVPLNFRMQKSMRAYGEKMSKLKPKLDALQKKHAGDRKALQKEMVEFQRENKMYPPVGGCLPMFITLPIFIGLFTALRVSYDLRQQPFMLWVNDLSQPDALFDIGLSWLPYFNLMPVIMAALWYWLQSATPLPKDPQQRQMMKIMRFMPVFMMVVLYNYASGLMVYMVTSSLFGLVEQRIVRKILGPPSAESAAFAPQTPM